MEKQAITSEELRDLLDYDSDTGMFRWKNITRKRSHKVGWFAGSRNRRGYLHIKISGSCYQAHRLAWLHINGSWPARVIDHINRDVADNRIENLRDVEHRDNLMNRRRYKPRVQTERAAA